MTSPIFGPGFAHHPIVEIPPLFEGFNEFARPLDASLRELDYRVVLYTFYKLWSETEEGSTRCYRMHKER